MVTFDFEFDFGLDHPVPEGYNMGRVRIPTGPPCSWGI
jgi:hypothetical protein